MERTQQNNHLYNNHMNLSSIFNALKEDYVFLSGFFGSVMGFIPTLFLDVSPFAEAIQMITGTGGVMILGITIFTKIVEAQRSYLKFLRERKNLKNRSEEEEE